jgi:hypothetical protein
MPGGMLREKRTFPLRRAFFRHTKPNHTMSRIKRFGVYQTSKVSAVLYFVVTAVFLIPFGLFFTMLGTGSDIPGFGFGGLFFFVLPFIYGLVGFVVTAICCAVYNLVARWTGGIEFELDGRAQGSAAAVPPAAPGPGL